MSDFRSSPFIHSMDWRTDLDDPFSLSLSIFSFDLFSSSSSSPPFTPTRNLPLSPLSCSLISLHSTSIFSPHEKKRFTGTKMTREIHCQKMGSSLSHTQNSSSILLFTIFHPLSLPRLSHDIFSCLFFFIPSFSTLVPLIKEIRSVELRIVTHCNETFSSSSSLLTHSLF